MREAIEAREVKTTNIFVWFSLFSTYFLYSFAFTLCFFRMHYCTRLLMLPMWSMKLHAAEKSLYWPTWWMTKWHDFQHPSKWHVILFPTKQIILRSFWEFCDSMEVRVYRHDCIFDNWWCTESEPLSHAYIKTISCFRRITAWTNFNGTNRTRNDGIRPELVLYNFIDSVFFYTSPKSGGYVSATISLFDERRNKESKCLQQRNSNRLIFIW